MSFSSSRQQTCEVAAGSGRRCQRHCDRRGGRIQVLQTPPDPHEQQVATNPAAVGLLINENTLFAPSNNTQTWNHMQTSCLFVTF